MTPNHQVPLTGLQTEAQTQRFASLEQLKGAPSISTPKGYARVANEFLTALEALPAEEDMTLRPRAYLSAQSLELILRAYIARFDKEKLEKLRDQHNIDKLTQIAVDLGDAGHPKLRIPRPDLPLWWEELAWLHGSPYLDRYPGTYPFALMEACQPHVTAELRRLLTEVEATIQQ